MFFRKLHFLHIAEEYFQRTVGYRIILTDSFAKKDLYHNQPGYEYVELLEDCELYAIRIEDLNQIYETNIEIANWGRVIHQECLLYMDIHHINRFIFRLKNVMNNFFVSNPISFTVPNWDI